jgi:hypothetical protein
LCSSAAGRQVLLSAFSVLCSALSIAFSVIQLL